MFLSSPRDFAGAKNPAFRRPRHPRHRGDRRFGAGTGVRGLDRAPAHGCSGGSPTPSAACACSTADWSASAWPAARSARARCSRCPTCTSDDDDDGRRPGPARPRRPTVTGAPRPRFDHRGAAARRDAGDRDRRASGRGRSAAPRRRRRSPKPPKTPPPSARPPRKPVESTTTPTSPGSPSPSTSRPPARAAAPPAHGAADRRAAGAAPVAAIGGTGGGGGRRRRYRRDGGTDAPGAAPTRATSRPTSPRPPAEAADGRDAPRTAAPRRRVTRAAYAAAATATACDAACSPAPGSCSARCCCWSSSACWSCRRTSTPSSRGDHVEIRGRRPERRPGGDPRRRPDHQHHRRPGQLQPAAGADHRADLRRRPGPDVDAEGPRGAEGERRARHVLRGRLRGGPAPRPHQADHRRRHELGLHTFTHPNMQRIAPWRRKLELSQTQVAIARAAGVHTNLVRFPYSSKTERDRRRELGTGQGGRRAGLPGRGQRPGQRGLAAAGRAADHRATPRRPATPRRSSCSTTPAATGRRPWRRCGRSSR